MIEVAKEFYRKLYCSNEKQSKDPQRRINERKNAFSLKHFLAVMSMFNISMMREARLDRCNQTKQVHC